jgi:CPA2 family monovalent cation:H+ antiporter-2
MESSTLLLNLALALVAAMLGALIAVRLRQSAVVGFIVAGIAIGPSTPGLVGDAEVVDALAELGIVFLLFAIGAQISLRDLLRVGTVAIVGGNIQVLAVLGIGFGVGQLLGWGLLESVFVGAVLSNSSSTVLGKVLGDRGETDTEHSHVALAWSTVQDLGTILFVVTLTALATTGGIGEELLIAIGKAIVFLAIVVPAGLRALPPVFEFLAATRSREVFLLGVVGLALGTALLASVFGISLALGAFLAGLVIGESDLSHRVVADALPFRDLFAGLFFVSVGMLVDPGFVLQNLPLAALMVFLIIGVKGLIVMAIALAFRFSFRTAALTGVALAQSAEFSFLLARLGADLEVVSPTVFSLMLAGAAASIILAAPLTAAAVPIVRRIERRIATVAEAGTEIDPSRAGRRTVVICGYEGIGRLIGQALERRGFAYLVIEEDGRITKELRDRGIAVIRGIADNAVVLEQAGLDRAAVLAVAVSDPIAARTIVDLARRSHPRLPIVVRAHSSAERVVLQDLGANEVVVGDLELGLEMARFTMRRLGVSATEAQALVNGLRG